MIKMNGQPVLMMTIFIKIKQVGVCGTQYSRIHVHCCIKTWECCFRTHWSMFQSAKLKHALFQC